MREKQTLPANSAHGHRNRNLQLKHSSWIKTFTPRSLSSTNTRTPQYCFLVWYNQEVNENGMDSTIPDINILIQVRLNTEQELRL